MSQPKPDDVQRFRNYSPPKRLYYGSEGKSIKTTEALAILAHIPRYAVVLRKAAGLEDGKGKGLKKEVDLKTKILKQVEKGSI
ncbi:hypothetical protein N7520_009163 [Penicillium odoratum]|uniref:uncharacterized protein n=1 Tax=Penicillium odoratum TaxID=1167516 RepID=UPI0025473F8E|nr:uncharacterized protein N7520_009163 [Penicillium odoratum]KAJ5752246.1 hypothetical protein N7520_009163 [Penicillium odoratum]